MQGSIHATDGLGSYSVSSLFVTPTVLGIHYGLAATQMWVLAPSSLRRFWLSNSIELRCFNYAIDSILSPCQLRLPPQNRGRTRSLLIGISYASNKHPLASTLDGCHEDVKNIKIFIEYQVSYCRYSNDCSRKLMSVLCMTPES